VGVGQRKRRNGGRNGVSLGILVVIALAVGSSLQAAAQSPSVLNGEAAGQTQPQSTETNANAPLSTSQAANDGAAKAAASGTENKPTEANVTNVLTPLADSIWSKRGVPVTAIKFDGVTFSADDAILGELTQKAGQPLDPDKVRADLRRLFASGRYRNIQVTGQTDGNGLALVYAGVARYYVGRIVIDGVPNERLSSLLEFSTKMDPGTAYTETQIPAALESIKETLSENGFFEATVKVSTLTDNIGHQVNAIFLINTGVQARVGNVTVTGADPGITVPKFRKMAKLDCSWIELKFRKSCRVKVGRETTNTALSDVRDYYQKENRLEATVSMQKQTYIAPPKQLNYHFADDQGPIVKVIINGVKVSKARTHLLIPVFEEGAVDRDLLNEGSFNLRDFLQQQGYFDAQVSVKLLGEKTQNVTVEYDVVPGVKHKVVAVNIAGNKYFDTDLLEGLLRVKKADAYIRNGTYSSQLVSADVDSITSLYRANGFSHAKVTSSVKDTDKDKRGEPAKVAQIFVQFTVVEGAQQKFGTVEFDGVASSREAPLRQLLNSQTGQPFSLITLSGDRDAVLGYYIAHGFDHAKIEIGQVVQKDDASRTDVTLNVSEGQQVFIDKVLLSGIVHTRPSVVQQQLTVHAGEPLDQAALLETQRRLYNLALFNEVNAAVQNPTGDAPEKNVLVQLTEAKRWDVTYGAGFEAQTGTPAVVPGQVRGGTAAQNGKAGISPRVSLDVSRINLRGTQDSLTLHATYGLLETIATLSFSNPQLFGHKNFTGSVSGGYSNVQNISTFQASTLQGDVRVTQAVKRADHFIYDFQFRRVSVNPDSLEITANLIPQLSEPVTVGGPQITYFHDTRDPSPLNAGKGQYFSFTEFIANSKFGSDTDFNKVDVSHSSYYTFGKKKYVFARNLRVGFENFFGQNPNASGVSGGLNTNNYSCSGNFLFTNPTCNAIPLPERLYAGGATSHRGFGINDAGPRDLTTGYPVGGSAVVVNSFELRLPPPTLPVVGDSVSFVVFLDSGNVFQSPKDMFSSAKNFSQPDQAACKNIAIPAGTPGPPAPTPVGTTNQQANAVGTCNFNYYSHAIGLGLRYGTPVGPIRVDFSYNLNPPVYPVFDDFSKANPNVAGAVPYVGQASHFNFFFSIGQAF
jgi:outer membrane protein insertion porin family